MGKTQYFLAKRPFEGESFCGDAGVIREEESSLFLAAIDALGHGKEAQKVALTAVSFLEHRLNPCPRDLGTLVAGLHHRLRGTRGAVAALCDLDLLTGSLNSICVGNITVRKFGSLPWRIVPTPGILGYQIRGPSLEKIQLEEGDVLLLHTDGVREHFDLRDYPELLEDDAKTIAMKVVDRFGRKQDDALCIALRYEG